MVGLGHIRRNLLIAQTITRALPDVATLVIGEARQAGNFTIAANVDTLTLPALRKVDGRCEPRYLDISLQKLVAMRSRAILGTLTAFEPDVLIVDHLPRGAMRELEPVLAQLRRRGGTRLVLGLRDVLEAPETVRSEWQHAANEAAIRDYYDAVWVYGDQTVYDQAREYGLSADIAARLRYLGYLDPAERLAPVLHSDDPLAGMGLEPGRLALCMVGGGQDGERLAIAFALAAPHDMNSVIVTGPFMAPDAQERLRQIAAAKPRLRVLDFVEEPTLLLRQADRLVAMGGYNTVVEALSFEKHTLVVPRALPRLEQRIRAERLRDLGLLHMLPEEELSPAALAAWLTRDLGPAPRVRDQIDLSGLARLPRMLGDLLAAQRRPHGAAPERSRAVGGWRAIA
jgi:predicted glycosyltransferase